MTLTQISFDRDFIVADIEVLNGGGTAMGFAWEINGGAIIEDDTGATYRLLHPKDNSDLVVEPGERLTGSLTFVGRVQSEATELTLTTNPTAGPDRESNEHTGGPRFVFEIPLDQ